jgi:hypothetical protein
VEKARERAPSDGETPAATRARGAKPASRAGLLSVPLAVGSDRDKLPSDACLKLSASPVQTFPPRS